MTLITEKQKTTKAKPKPTISKHETVAPQPMPTPGWTDRKDD